MKILFFCFFLFPVLLMGQQKNTGFLFNVGALYRTDNTINAAYEVGAYTHFSDRYVFCSYGGERHSFLKFGSGGEISEKVKADFAFIFYVSAGFYGDKVRLPQHFGGMTSLYLKKDVSPYIRVTVTTLQPTIEVGMKYHLGFIN